MAKRSDLQRNRPTDSELEKVGAATLAAKYGTTKAQIILWRKEAKERVDQEIREIQDLKRVEHIREVLGDATRRGLHATDLDPSDPDYDLLVRLLQEDPGPSRDERDRLAGHTKMDPDPGPGYFNARLLDPNGGDGMRYADPPSYIAYRPDAADWRDRPDPGDDLSVRPDTYLPLFGAFILAVMLIGMIAMGIWK